MKSFEPINKNNLESSFDGVLGRLYAQTQYSLDEGIYNDSHIDVEEDSDEYDFEEFLGISSGRRKECKAKGLKGKKFRDCLKELKKEDKGLSKSEQKALGKKRKEEFNEALLEGKVKKGKALRTIQKFNPASLLLRGSVFAAFRTNMFGISSRLYPAYLTEAQAKEKHFDVSNLPAARKALEKVKAFFMRIGGDPSKLETPIRKAHDKPILNTKKSKERARKEKSGIDGDHSNLTGFEEGLITTGAATAGTVITVLVSKAGAKKNPYAPDSPQAKAFDSAATDAPQPTAQDLKAVADAEKGALADKAKGLPLDGGSTTSDDKIWGFNKYVVYGVGTIITAAVLYMGYKIFTSGNKNPTV